MQYQTLFLLPLKKRGRAWMIGHGHFLESRRPGSHLVISIRGTIQPDLKSRMAEDVSIRTDFFMNAPPT